MTTAGIVEIMKQVEAARQDERKLDAQEKSLLKHLGRSQRALFLALSTPELYIDPELSVFMVQLSKEKTATRALQLIQSEAREWEGSFSAGGFHRFLSTGFLSQGVNRGNPGGYTLFMFHTRTKDLGGPQFDAGKARLRDLFEASVDEETILHYSKQGLFAASNHDDMRVQLQTALDMLKLLLGAGSIATKGLAYVLEPQRWRRMSVIFHDRIKSKAQFGAKFVYCLDRSLQQFFTQVERRNKEEVRLNYLRDKAVNLISMMDGGYEVTVRLPSSLVPPPPAILALPASTSAAGEQPAKKKGKKSGTPGPAGEPGSMVIQNSPPTPPGAYLRENAMPSTSKAATKARRIGQWYPTTAWARGPLPNSVSASKPPPRAVATVASRTWSWQASTRPYVGPSTPGSSLHARRHRRQLH